MKRLRVGTDYSGIETPLMALQALRIPYRHIFSSESCPKIRAIIEERFAPERIFKDALKRRGDQLPSKLDLYVAGFPCQLFSSLNYLTGNHRNPKNPLRHFYGCVRTIQTCRPTTFVLENVTGLVTSNEGKHFVKINEALGALPGYDVTYMILNARDYGSPQNRRRLIIVGMMRRGGRRGRPPTTTTTNEDIVLPPPTVARARLPTFASIREGRRATRRRVISTGMQRLLDACAERYEHPVFIQPRIVNMKCSAARFPPALTRRGEGLYSSKHRQMTTVREEMRLQGIPDNFRFPEHVSDTFGREMVGNAMSVNVMTHLFRQVLKARRSRRSRRPLERRRRIHHHH